MKYFKQSIGDWMIENLGEDSIDKYWSPKNEKSPFEIGKGTAYDIWIKCQCTNYHPDTKTTAHKFINRGDRCSYCSGKKVHPNDSFAQWCIDNIDKDFLEKYWSTKNILNPFKLAKSSIKEIWIKCQIKNYHEDYKTKPNFFIRHNQRCPFCGNTKKVHILDSLGSTNQESIQFWSDKNHKSPFEYSPFSHKIVFWKCHCGKHEDYKRRISTSKRCNFRCPECSLDRKESMLQEKVRLFLTETLNMKINHENACEIKCINPITNLALPYDNEIINNYYKLIIETHGEQHYTPKGYNVLTSRHKGTTPQQEFEYMQWKDQYKMDYAISQGYHYAAIPYWADNENEDWKSLIINKLNEIQSNYIIKNLNSETFSINESVFLL